MGLCQKQNNYLCLYQQVNFKGASLDFFEYQQTNCSSILWAGGYMCCVQTVSKEIDLYKF